MQFGLQLLPHYPGEYGNHFDTSLAVVRACEEAGFDSAWMADHFMFPDPEHPEKEKPVLECFVTLAALAAATERIRLGQLVAGAPYRNPALVAKMCATLDVISHGRTIIGLGAAWHEPEFTAYGWTFPPVRERMEMLEEAVRIVDLMLTQRPATFHGKHFSIQDAYNDPVPVQKPRPPIMIGGDGERVTLKLVARYADFCNVADDAASVARKLDVLHRHCDAVGRPFEEITLCANLGLVLARSEAELDAKKERHPSFCDACGTPDMVVEQLLEYARIGCTYVTFHMPDAEDVELIHLFGREVLPHLATV